MPTPQISRAARTRVVDRLANVTNGFNPSLLAALADAGIPVPIGWRLPINFAVPGRNFFQADIKPDDLPSTTTSTYPALTLFTTRVKNENWQKFQLFSGPVTFGLNVFCAFETGRVLPNFELIMDCVEEALFVTFNSPSIAEAWDSDSVLVYNGDLSLSRSKLMQGSTNWLQIMSGQFTADVNSAG